MLTQFGIITIDKNDIIKTQHQVKLNTGETFIGEIINETPDTIILKTKMGELTLPNSDILNKKKQELKKLSLAERLKLKMKK